MEELFGARLHWLVTLRAQPSWIESYYLYTFVDYLEVGGVSFDAWAAAERQRPSNPFTCADYAATLEPLAERVGTGRLMIAPMEALLRDDRGLATRRLPAFLGIEAETVAGLFAAAQPTKERVWEHQLVLGRTVRLARQAGMGRASRWLLRRLLARLDRRLLAGTALRRAQVGCRFDTLFDAVERAAIVRGNRWLAAQCGIDLAAYGYPLS
jgi:hypothetical protein